MTQLPAWTYVGVVPISDDLSVLEAALHSGRVAAAERGYPDEPVSIETVEAMPLNSADGDYGDDGRAEVLTAEQAEQRGVEFVPSVLRFQMEWAAAPDQT